MGRVPITVMGYRCDRCDHEWIPRGDLDEEPKVCPKCKSPYWNRPRKLAPPMTYERFRDTIRDVLLEGPPEGLTWTDIRTRAKLPQAFPNNQWVRRMERDIALTRLKDGHGILHWTLGTPEHVTDEDADTKPPDGIKRRPREQQGRLE